MLVKRVKNDILAMEKVLFVAKKSYSIHFTNSLQQNDAAMPLLIKEPNSTIKELSIGESGGDKTTTETNQADGQKNSTESAIQSSKSGEKSKADNKSERGF